MIMYAIGAVLIQLAACLIAYKAVQAAIKPAPATREVFKPIHILTFHIPVIVLMYLAVGAGVLAAQEVWGSPLPIVIRERVAGDWFGLLFAGPLGILAWYVFCHTMVEHTRKAVQGKKTTRIQIGLLSLAMYAGHLFGTFWFMAILLSFFA